ncbi:hypothetical protein NFI96_004829 [Prochilodus magdalenae]|nr:hypothetical protein NFI96_004829 [Prochilodus magdalenae]
MSGISGAHKKSEDKVCDLWSVNEVCRSLELSKRPCLSIMVLQMQEDSAVQTNNVTLYLVFLSVKNPKIDGSTVEIVKSTKFLGVHLAEDLTWSLNTSTITKKAQQRLYFLRRLRKAHLPPPILTTFYRGTIESILSSCITAWFGNCTASDRKSLQRVVRTAEKIIGVSLPTITDIYTTRCIRKTTSIVDDHTHPSHTLFTLLPSGKRYRSIRALTSRLCNSFFPHAIRLLNNQSLV